MTPEDFQALFESLHAVVAGKLHTKSVEYARGNDKFHNFKKYARMERCTPEQALWRMMMKHHVSISDILDDLEHCSVAPEAVSTEKITDEIAYLYLLEGLLRERRAKCQTD